MLGIVFAETNFQRRHNMHITNEDTQELCVFRDEIGGGCNDMAASKLIRAQYQQAA